MAKTRRADMMEKLSALQPHIPTSTRAKKTAKAAPSGKKVTAKKAAAVKKPAAGKAVAPRPVAAKAKEPPPKRAEVQEALPLPKAAEPEKPREAAPPKPEKAALPFEGFMKFPFTMPGNIGLPFEGMMAFPFTVIEFWSGCLRSCYRMAETQANFLINMSCWRQKF